jgi:predicted ATPase
MAAEGEAQVVQSETVVLPVKPRALFNRPTTSICSGFSTSTSVGTMVEEPVREISRVERTEEHVAVVPSFADVAASNTAEHAKLLDTAGAERVTLMTEPELGICG